MSPVWAACSETSCLQSHTCSHMCTLLQLHRVAFQWPSNPRPAPALPSQSFSAVWGAGGDMHARGFCLLFEPGPMYWAATLCRALCWAFHVLTSSNRHDKKHLNSEKELAGWTDTLTWPHLGNHKGDLWVTGSWNSPRGSTGEQRAQLHFKYLHYRRECVKSDKASTAQPAEPENTSY